MKYQEAISVARAALLEYARSIDDECFIVSFGANDVHPRHIACWLCCQTDDQKQRLTDDESIQSMWRDTLISNGYPDSVREWLNVTVESQEYVDRECEGNWRYAMQ